MKTTFLTGFERSYPTYPYLFPFGEVRTSPSFPKWSTFHREGQSARSGVRETTALICPQKFRFFVACRSLSRKSSHSRLPSPSAHGNFEYGCVQGGEVALFEISVTNRYAGGRNGRDRDLRSFSARIWVLPGAHPRRERSKPTLARTSISPFLR